MNVAIDNLADKITSELTSYVTEVSDDLKDEVKKIAKDTASQIKSASPKKSGDYRKGWTSKCSYSSNKDVRYTVYNRTKPQLTHLLEHGHAKVGGGRVRGIEHIAPAEQYAIKELEKKVKVIAK